MQGHITGAIAREVARSVEFVPLIDVVIPEPVIFLFHTGRHGPGGCDVGHGLLIFGGQNRVAQEAVPDWVPVN